MTENSQVNAGAPRVPPVPRALGKEGRAEWKRLCSQYVFAPGEIGLLTEYCANVDMIAALRAELAGKPMIVNSPQAGPVVARPVAEIRACQGELRKLAELLRFRELAVDAELAQFPALRGTDVLHARPVIGQVPAGQPAGPRSTRTHRRTRAV